MADYDINDEKWNAKVSMIESHMANNDVGDMAAVLEWNLTKGLTDPENRKRYWQNITNMFATVDNTPIRLGKASTQPLEVQAAKKTICATYVQGLIVLFASHPLYGDTERARGKKGYTPYTSAEAYANAQGKNLHSRLTTQYNSYVAEDKKAPQWDGLMNKDGSISGHVIYPMEVEG